MKFKQVCSLAVTATLLLSSARAVDSYGDVDVFYAYLTGIAQDAGFNTATLPANPSPTFKQSVATYFWGFPLQTTYRTQISFLNGNGLAVNELFSPGTIDAGTTVEAPDVDVFYTSAFLALTGSTAFVLKVPDTTATNTYNVMGIVTAYGDTTYSVGTRNFTTSAGNNSGGNYLLVGPDYDTSLPLPGGIISLIQSPTAQTWLISRMEVDSYAMATLNGQPTPYNLLAGGAASPLSAAYSAPLAQSYAVTPLAAYLNGQTTQSTATSDPTDAELAISQANATTKTGQAFFQYVGDSAAQNGVPSSPASNDQLAMYSNFAGIGLTTSGYTPPSLPIQTEMNQAATDAANMLATMSANTSALPGGGATSTNWTVNTTLGNYPATYEGWAINALTANIGTVANLAVDGVYPQTTIDSKGNALNGANAYTITFPAGQLPPVQGFWSITVYNTAGYVVPNTGNTFYGDNVYSIGSMQMANVLGANLNSTPVTFYLQSTPPADPALMPYWLPIPTGNFELLLRMYFPNSTAPSILNGTYTIPAVVAASAAATHGLTMAAAGSKNRATFTITNTGSTTATFALSQTRRVSNSYHGPAPTKPGSPAFKLVTKIGGRNITNALAKQKASLSLGPGESVKVVTEAKISRPLARQRTIRVTLSATDQASPSTQANRQTKIILPATAP